MTGPQKHTPFKTDQTAGEFDWMFGRVYQSHRSKCSSKKPLPGKLCRCCSFISINLKPLQTSKTSCLKKDGTFQCFPGIPSFLEFCPEKCLQDPRLVQLQSNLEFAVRKSLPCCRKVLEKLGNQNGMPIVGTHRFPSFLV